MGGCTSVASWVLSTVGGQGEGGGIHKYNFRGHFEAFVPGGSSILYVGWKSFQGLQFPFKTIVALGVKNVQRNICKIFELVRSLPMHGARYLASLLAGALIGAQGALHAADRI